jgi:hypothetical protein
MLDLVKLDNELTVILFELRKIVQETQFNEQFSFILNENISYVEFDKLKWCGIYLIEIKTNSENSSSNWITEFTNEWQKPEYEKGFVPNSKAKRIKFHNEPKIQEWFPLYIGKSKNVSNRLKGHLDLKLTQPTTSLKLRERKNMYGNEFRISTIKLDVLNYELIAPQFESGMREKINPILGRQ